MADKKISEMATASVVDNDDNLELSHSVNGGFTSLKASILAIATKMLTAINFTSALETTNKTVIGAINEVAQGGGGGGASELDDLDDVEITNPTEGQALVYDETNEVWVNGAGSGGTTVIANPTGTPTDDLNSIQIGNDIYRIVGGGGGGGTAKALVMKTKTWTGDGSNPCVLTFTEKPFAIFNIYGDGLGGSKVLNSPFVYGETNYYLSSYSSGVLFNTVSYSNNGLTMTMSGVDEGAVFNANGSQYTMWYLVEEEVGGGGSADWTDVVGTLEAGQTEIVLTSNKITTNSAVFPWTNKFGVAPTNMVVATGSVTLTFPVQSTDLAVMVRVTEVGGAPEPTPIDTTNTSKYNESSMDVVSSSSQIASVWNGGNAIGLTFYLTEPIDVTDLTKLYYELQTSNCYGGGSQAQQERWNVQIGLMATAPSALLNGTYSELSFAAGDDFANSNTNYGTQEIDVSSLSGTYYLVVNAHGWNATISNLREE